LPLAGLYRASVVSGLDDLPGLVPSGIRAGLGALPSVSVLDSDQLSARRVALKVAVDGLPVNADPSPGIGCLPVTGAQWNRSVADADVDTLLSRYLDDRLRLTSNLNATEVDLDRHLRPAAADVVSAAGAICESLRLLAVLNPGDSGPPEVADDWGRLVSKDAHALLAAALDGTEPPPPPAWPAFSEVPSDEDRDVLVDMFGIGAEDLRDDEGTFCDTRVLAAFRLRLPDLKRRCDPILSLVAEHPPSVFTAVSAARDLATSTSPWVTLAGAREIRKRILDSFDADPALARDVLAEAAREGDEEWMAFERLQGCLLRAERARSHASGTERDYAVAILEAYRHMADGITRRCIRTLLCLSGINQPPRTVGALGPPAVARLGDFGARIERALMPVMRNAEAHDDFSFDEDSGLLVLDDAAVEPDEILAHLTELDVLQRAFIVGRLAAFADQPGLVADVLPDPRVQSSASSALVFARQRFGHAGQRVRSFVRDRDRLNVVVDGLESEACNPCFVALTQAAQVLPTVTRFSVLVTGRNAPVIDLPSSVLHENWKVFLLAAKWFPDALPQETFLPCLAWSRLACESVEDAVQASAWLALNDACHAILDSEADSTELRRLPGRFGTIVAATSSTMRLLPDASHEGPLAKVQRLILATGNVFARDPHGMATSVLVDRIFSLRDALGGPVAVLPTLDPTPLQGGSFPHAVS
jgi:hypothetical protein